MSDVKQFLSKTLLINAIHYYWDDPAEKTRVENRIRDFTDNDVCLKSLPQDRTQVGLFLQRGRGEESIVHKGDWVVRMPDGKFIVMGDTELYSGYTPYAQ